MGRSSSKSSSTNPTTTGYGYGGGQQGGGSGFLASGIGDDLNDDGAIATGSGYNFAIDGSNVGDITIRREDVSDEVLAAAGRALGDGFAGFAEASADQSRDAFNFGESVFADAAALSDDIAGEAFKFSDDIASEAFKFSEEASERAAGTADAALDVAADATRQAVDLSDDLFSGANETIQRANEESVRLAGNAIDASTDKLKRALDFGDKSLAEVAAFGGESLDAVAGIVEQAFAQSDSAYDDTLSALTQNARDTAEAFTRAQGGQSQATQETIRKLIYASAGVAGVVALASAWR